MTKFRIAGSLFVAAALTMAGCDKGSEEAPKDGAKKTAKNEGAKKTPAKAGDKTPDAKPAEGDKAPEGAAAKTGAAAALAAVEAYNAGKFEDALAGTADNVKMSFIGTEEVALGRDKIIAGWKEGRVAIPDLTLTPTRILDFGDVVATEYVVNGTNTGAMGDKPATNKPIGYGGMILTKTDGGKVTEYTVFANGLAGPAQMGLMADMPAPPVAEKPTGKPEIVEGEANADNVKLVKQWYAVAGSFKDSWKLCEEKLCSKELTAHNVADGKTNAGLDAVKADWEGMSKAFPDAKFTVDSMHSVGDWVLVRATATGTHKGDWGPIKATDKSITVHLTDIVKVQDGKMTEIWSYMNPQEMMAQLGLMPPKPEAEATVAKK